MNNLTDQNFETELNSAGKPVLIDFFATWCPPCSVLGPILEKVAKEFEDRIVFSKVDVDTVPLTAQKYKVERIPTVILFKEGKPVSGFLGVQEEKAIREWLEKELKQ